MDQPTETFEQVRAILKLKRYEVPPPGYFVRFSAQVIARIERDVLHRPGIIERFWLAFEARPALAATYGALVGGLMVCGFFFSEETAQPASGFAAQTAQGLPLVGESSAHNRLNPYAVPAPAGFPGQQAHVSTAPEFLLTGSSLGAQTVGFKY